MENSEDLDSEVYGNPSKAVQVFPSITKELSYVGTTTTSIKEEIVQLEDLDSVRECEKYSKAVEAVPPITKELSDVRTTVTIVKEECLQVNCGPISLKEELGIFSTDAADQEGVAEFQESKCCSVGDEDVSFKTKQMSEDFSLTEVFIKVEPNMIDSEPEDAIDSKPEMDQDSPINSIWIKEVKDEPESPPPIKEGLTEYQTDENISTFEDVSKNVKGTSFDLSITENSINKEEALEIDNETEDEFDCIAGFEEDGEDDPQEDPLAEPLRGKVCSKSLKSKQEVKHQPEHSSGVNKFECTHCDKGFTNEGDFEKHQLSHDGKKVWECGWCLETFGRWMEVVEHSEVHRRKNGLTCEVCTKKFTKMSELRQHMLRNTMPRCDVCGKKFRHESKLKIHRRFHTSERPYPCTVCEKRFQIKNNLVKHMWIHTEKKPFPCTLCEKRFGVKQLLVAHMCTHTGEKPYSCEDCGRKFTRKDNLQRHLEKVHSQEHLS